MVSVFSNDFTGKKLGQLPPTPLTLPVFCVKLQVKGAFITRGFTPHGSGDPVLVFFPLKWHTADL